MKSSPLAEVRGVSPEVYGDVPYVTGKYANELALRFSELIVEAAENAS